MTKKTPTPFERMSRTVCVDRLDERLARFVEQKVSLVEEEHDSRLVAIADLRKLLEELGDDPHEHCRPQPWPVLHRRQLEARDDSPPVRCGAQEVCDVELRLAEEVVPAALLEADQ